MDQVNVLSAFKTGWKLTKSHFIVTLGLVLGYFVVSMLFSFPATGVMAIVLILLSLVVSSIWTLGITRLTLDVVDGDDPRFGVFGEMLPRLGSFIVMMIAMCLVLYVPFLLIVLLGVVVNAVDVTDIYQIMGNNMSIYYLLGIIAMVYLCLRLYWSTYIFVDRKVGPIDALKMSWAATAPVQGKILLYLFLVIVIALAGILCLVVGVFVSMMVVLYASAALYRQVFPAGLQDPLIVEDANVVVG